MKFFRSNIIYRTICWFFALVILNCSIDPPDVLTNTDNDVALEEDLTLNEMESVAELVLEIGLDIKDAVPETDDSDTESLLKKIEYSIQENVLSVIFCRALYDVTPVNVDIPEDAYKAFDKDILAPPPKV